MKRNLSHAIVLVLLAMAVVCVSPFASYANTSTDPPGVCASVVNDVGHCFTGNTIYADQGISNTCNAAIATNTGSDLGLVGAISTANTANGLNAVDANYTYTMSAQTAPNNMLARLMTRNYRAHHAGKGGASIVNLLAENPGAIATNANRATYWPRI